MPFKLGVFANNCFGAGPKGEGDQDPHFGGLASLLPTIHITNTHLIFKPKHKCVSFTT